MPRGRPRPEGSRGGGSSFAWLDSFLHILRLRLLVNRGAMTFRQERANHVAAAVEPEGVGASFGGDGLVTAEGGGAEHLDDAPVAGRDVEATHRRIQEPDVRATRQRPG